MTAPEQSRTTPESAPRPPPGPSSIGLVIGGLIARADIPGLCERVRSLLENSGAEVIECDVGALIHPDAATVDALARMQLTARRLGRLVRLRRASGELQELLALVGLLEVVPPVAGLPLELRRQPEEGEQACGFQEEGDPDDATG